MKNTFTIVLLAFLFVSCKKDRPDLTLQGEWIVEGYSTAYFDSNNNQLSPYTLAFVAPVKLSFEGNNVVVLDEYDNTTIIIPFTSNKYGKEINLSLGEKGMYFVKNWNVVKEFNDAISLIGDISHAFRPPYFHNNKEIAVDHVLIKLDLKRVN